MPWWASWVLTLFGVSSLWMAGAGRWWAWGLCIINECLWIWYAIATHQYGFIVGAIAYGTVNARHLHAGWQAVRAEQRAKIAPSST